MERIEVKWFDHQDRLYSHEVVEVRDAILARSIWEFLSGALTFFHRISEMLVKK